MNASPIRTDMSAGGQKTVTIVPSTAPQPITFTMPEPKGDTKGNYNRATEIVFELSTTFDQAASAGTVASFDDLPIICQSMQGSCPEMGMTHEPACFTGPVAKLLIEPFCQGYGQYAGALAQIPVTDGDTTVPLYFTLPFQNRSFIDPYDFCPWTQVLHDFEAIFTFNVASAIGTAIGDAAVVKAPTSLACWLESVPKRSFGWPTINQWRAYSVPMGTQALLTSVGQVGGLTCVEAGSRLALLAETLSPKNMGGLTTGDNFTSFECPAIGQPLTVSMASFPAFLVTQRRRSFFFTATGATATQINAGWPYTLTSSPTKMNSAAELFRAWKAYGLNAEIGEAMKWAGNITANRTFAGAFTAGNEIWVSNEHRQLTEIAGLRWGAIAGLDPTQWANRYRDYAEGRKPATEGAKFAMPSAAPPKAK